VRGRRNCTGDEKIGYIERVLWNSVVRYLNEPLPRWGQEAEHAFGRDGSAIKVQIIECSER
jgi:hypothetical protein